MARVASAIGLQPLATLFDSGSLTGLSDRQLLDRFTTSPEPDAQVAFSALVTRHGPMVLRVCTHLLHDEHHAQDAFQAVFLILARKARSIQNPEKLSNWLYGVALRTARYTRNQSEQKAESPVLSAPQYTTLTPDQSLLNREQAELLHAEIHRLPRHFRLAILLHYFEGLSIDEAATHLQVARGTVASRLNRAREKLKRSLTRRGFELSTTTLITSLSSKPAFVHITSELRDQTTRAAMQFAAGKTTLTAATAIATEVLKAMVVPKLKLAGLLLCTLALTASGAGVLAQALSTTVTPPERPGEKPQPTLPGTAKLSIPRPGPGRMFVTGRVLDPNGKPIPSAAVMVHARPKLRTSNHRGGYSAVLGNTTTNPEGHFRLDSARTSSATHEEFAAVAFAPGYAVGWTNLNPSADQPTADIHLEPGSSIHGRLFDLQGQPAAGVKLSVTSIERILPQGPDFLALQFDGVRFTSQLTNDLPAWPKPMTTDAEGRFTLHGGGRNQQLKLNVIDDRFAHQEIEARTDGPSPAKPISMALHPAKILAGRITYADNGKPVPHAQIRVLASIARRSTGATYFESDNEGHFHANPGPGDRFGIAVFAPEGTPYLRTGQSIDWPKGTIEHKVDFTLPRGVLIRGKVSDAVTSKPISGASVNFLPRSSEQLGALGIETSHDGSFSLAVSPGSGYLTVLAATEDYRLLETSEGMMKDGKPSGQRRYVNALIPCEPKSTAEPLEINVPLEPGLTVKGRIQGPDGQIVQDTSVLSHFAMKGLHPAYRWWRGHLYTHALNGQFELHGLDATTQTSVSLLEPKRRLGATVNVSGNMAASGPITVRLEPCGSAKARLVGPSGMPIKNWGDPYIISIVLIPESSLNSDDKNRLNAETDVLTRIDLINYEKEPVSDASGQILFPALIPGTTYRLTDRTAQPGTRRRKQFTVKPGETLDLGDILIEKPIQ